MKRKGILLSTLLVMVLFSGYTQAQSEQIINTKKNTIRYGQAVSLGITTNMGDMKDFLTAAGEDSPNPTMGTIGYSALFNVFMFDNFSYLVRVNGYMGTSMKFDDDEHLSMVGVKASLGFEYFFNLGGKAHLSLLLALTDNTFGYFYNDNVARYDNVALSIGATYWYRKTGFSLEYEPCLWKSVHNNPTNMPKVRANMLSLSLRF